MAYYDREYHPTTGGFRGWIGGYRGAIGGYRGAKWGRGYDRDYGAAYKSRRQTDYGDPFGDRDRRTPLRWARGAARRAYDGEVRGRGYDAAVRRFW